MNGLTATLARDLVALFDADARADAHRGGVLGALDPRVRLTGALTLAVAGVLTARLAVLALLLGLIAVLAVAAEAGWRRLARLWLGVGLFTGAIALPALFLVPGTPLVALSHGWPAISQQGMRAALLLLGRSLVSAGAAFLLASTTRWPHVLKSLRSLGLPVALVAVLGMTHRYVFVLANSALELLDAQESRLCAPIGRRRRIALAMSGAGVLLGRSLRLSAEVHQAMVARGYRGEVRLLDTFRMRKVDWLVLGVLLALLLLAWW